MIRKFLKDIIPKSFYVYLLLFFFFLYVTNAPETLNASLYFRDVEMTDDEYRDLLHVILYYKEVCKNELSEESIEEKWIGPKNTELFSNAFTDKDVFLELRKKNILNRKNLQEMTEMMEKGWSRYDGEKMCTISFNYDGYEFKFPYYPDDKIRYLE